nr:MAG TPA: hypothetical protein [Microviridae sp.]
MYQILSLSFCLPQTKVHNYADNSLSFLLNFKKDIIKVACHCLFCTLKLYLCTSEL